MNDRENYIKDLLSKYGDTVNRICYMYLHNKADAEDAFQEIYLKLFLRGSEFDDEEHEKAWVIRVSINYCKDVIKSYWFRKVDIRDEIEQPEKRGVIKTNI